MVCANPHAQFIREFDTFRNKVGLPTTPEIFPASVQRELQENAWKLGLDFGEPQLPEQFNRRRAR